MVRRLTVNACQLLPSLADSRSRSIHKRVWYHVKRISYCQVPLFASITGRNCLLPPCCTPSFTSMASSNIAVFSVKPDCFDCIVLDLRASLHECSDDEFPQRLNSSLEEWNGKGVRAVTMFIPSQLASRIPTALQLGFDFHHAKPGYVLMLKWLSDSETNNFPAYANHFLGVGGLVVNDNGEILVIKEKLGPGTKWKYPGGGADPGEDLETTAMREVLEETGIETEFVGVLCYRHFHEFRYGCSDFYQACLLKATTTEIKPCTQEISACQWMKLEEFGQQDLYPTSRFIYDSYLQYLQTGLLIAAHQTKSSFGDSHHTVYRAEKVKPSALEPKPPMAEPSDRNW